MILMLKEAVDEINKKRQIIDVVRNLQDGLKDYEPLVVDDDNIDSYKFLRDEKGTYPFSKPIKGDTWEVTGFTLAVARSTYKSKRLDFVRGITSKYDGICINLEDLSMKEMSLIVGFRIGKISMPMLIQNMDVECNLFKYGLELSSMYKKYKNRFPILLINRENNSLGNVDRENPARVDKILHQLDTVLRHRHWKIFQDIYRSRIIVDQRSLLKNLPSSFYSGFEKGVMEKVASEPFYFEGTE